MEIACQTGGGGGCFGCMSGSGVKQVYVGSPDQRGRGIGSWLGGLARQAFPIIRRGLANIGKESVQTGVNVLGDIMSGRPPKYAMKRRVIDSTDKLKRKFNDYMEGLGHRKPKRRCRKKKYIAGKGKKKRQSVKTRKRRQTSSKLKKKIVKKQKKLKRKVKKSKKKKNKINFDIFS